MAVFQLGITLQDAYDRTFTKRYEIEAVDFAGAQTAAGAFLTDLTAAIGAEVLRYTVGQETTYTDTVDAGANKDEGITLTFLKLDNKKATIRIPTPLKADYVLSDGSVDTTDTLIVNLAAHFIAGPVYISDGETASELLYGELDK